MIIVNSIQERDLVSDPILYVSQDDGSWKVYQKGDEDLLPPFNNQSIPDSRFVSVNYFRNLFTTEELAAINTKAYVDEDVNVQMLLLKVFTAENGVDMLFEETIQGVGYLEMIGAIAPGRAQVILNG